jgi:hypothetical protein
MSFFYDLNKKLDGIRATPEVTHKQLNERDEGKPGKNFAKIAKDAGERYGSKAAGERVAGAVRNKLKDQGKLEEEGMSRAAKGYEKYGREGMEALAKAGREGKALDPVRKKYDKYDNEQVDEKVEIYTRGADADWASMSRSAKNPNDPGAVAHRKSAADAARAARTGGDLKFKGQSPVTDIATTGQGRKVQAMKSKDVQEGGSYLNYADSAAENPAPPKKPMAAPKPQGVMDKVKSIGNKVAGGINRLVGHGSDEEMRQDVQRKAGVPATGKMPNFADKIASAKKEVDEMLGDVAAEAMRSALSPKQKGIAKMAGNPNEIGADDLAALRKGRKPEMDEERSKGTAFDMSTPRAAAPKVGSVERGHKHDIKHTATGRMVTRRVDDQGNSVGADDDSDTQTGPRGRGRPKGTKGAIGAKGPSGRSKLMTKEGDHEDSELKAAIALLKKA